MRRLLLTGIASLFLLLTVWGQPFHYKIAVIGSSTAAGTGASIPDSSWVRLTSAYLKNLQEIDTIYNFAVGGTVTGNGAFGGADTGISWVMTNYSPDIVIVSYASNDAVGAVPLDTTMRNLRLIYSIVTGAGKICWITTPHPRDNLTVSELARQIGALDSTAPEFPMRNMDFWTPLVATNGDSIAGQYNFDGVHINNAGHQALFQVVKNANILSPLISPLALVLDNFTAMPQQNAVLLNWTAAASGPLHFVVQRSTDGASYTNICEMDAADNLSGTNYSWKDANPFPGHLFYRLQTTASGKVSYSPIVSLNIKGMDWAIGDIYLPQGGSQLTVTLQSSKNRNVTLGVFDVTGRRITGQTGYAAAPESRIILSVSGLAQGQYFLRVISDDGQLSSKAFLKW
ncbi:MAG TPA: GDSL-type esterase/lipase family protein [Puia sp.]|nr:GDSL-type esterase/lipase family protein [Puia sp.]